MQGIPDELLDSVLESAEYLRIDPLVQRMLLRGCDPIFFCPMHLTLRGPTRMYYKTRVPDDQLVTCELTPILINPKPRGPMLREWACTYSTACIYSNMIMSSVLRAVDSDVNILARCEAYTQLNLKSEKHGVFLTPEFATERLAMFVKQLKEGKGELVV